LLQQSDGGFWAARGNTNVYGGVNGGPGPVSDNGGFSTVRGSRSGFDAIRGGAVHAPYNGGLAGGPGHAPGFLGNQLDTSGVNLQVGWQPISAGPGDGPYTAMADGAPP